MIIEYGSVTLTAQQILFSRRIQSNFQMAKVSFSDVAKSCQPSNAKTEISYVIVSYFLIIILLPLTAQV